MINILDHFNEHEAVLGETKKLIENIDQASKVIINSLSNNGCIFWCGNGGSESDSHHLAGELIGRFVGNRKPLRSIALGTGGAEGSCISNDFGFDNIFSRQLEGLGNKGDILVAISTSGNSQNILNAIEVAKNKEIQVISFLGKGGGRSLEFSDIPILIQSHTTARVQEMHILIGHILCDLIEEGLNLK